MNPSTVLETFSSFAAFYLIAKTSLRVHFKAQRKFRQSYVWKSMFVEKKAEEMYEIENGDLAVCHGGFFFLPAKDFKAFPFYRHFHFCFHWTFYSSSSSSSSFSSSVFPRRATHNFFLFFHSMAFFLLFYQKLLSVLLCLELLSHLLTGDAGTPRRVCVKLNKPSNLTSAAEVAIEKGTNKKGFACLSRSCFYRSCLSRSKLRKRRKALGNRCEITENVEWNYRGDINSRQIELEWFQFDSGWENWVSSTGSLLFSSTRLPGRRQPAESEQITESFVCLHTSLFVQIVSRTGRSLSVVRVKVSLSHLCFLLLEFPALHWSATGGPMQDINRPD